ncbi:hypothetical protein DV735_g7, partial [Chaetothyriales sp. CBS 134920]
MDTTDTTAMEIMDDRMAEAVADLTDKALDDDEERLSEPHLDALLDANQEALAMLVRRQLGLIERRSADAADLQVTVFDMALVRLTEGGKDVEFMPALRFFVKEYMAMTEQELAKVPMCLHKLRSPHPPQVGNCCHDEEPEEREEKLSPNLRKLLEVYERSRAEYLALADDGDRRTVDAAKFLRDTVENVFDSLRRNNNTNGATIDADKRAELKAMAAIAKEVVEKLCGGRKRKFDPKFRDYREHRRFRSLWDQGQLWLATAAMTRRLAWPSTSNDASNEFIENAHLQLRHRAGSRGSSMDSDDEDITYTAEEERGVVRRLDRRLVLFLSLLYLLSFLDRSNIGNARIAGLESSLRLSSSQYDWLLTAFYICYIAFEWMIMLYRVLPARVYIPLCVLSWGLIASVQSVATSFSQLLVLRGLLGVAEAAFGPGVPFYLSFFYKRSELAYRVGLQISAAPLATSFASSLAWLVVRLSRNGPVESWRVLFLVEGFPSVIAAINWSQILHTLRDPKCYLTALMFFSVNVSFASLPVFLPTIIHAMDFSPLASQALAAPPYLCAFAFLLVIAHHSDRIRDSRSLFLVGAALLSAASYATIALAAALRAHGLLGHTASILIRYCAVYGAAIGLFTAVTLIITWTLNNQPSAEAKGTGMVVLNLVGQCGPLVGVRLFPKTHGPEYVPGMAVCAGFMAAVALLSAALRWYML